MKTVHAPKKESLTLVIPAPKVRLRSPKGSQRFADKRTKRSRTRSQQRRLALAD